jgi:hypothetical protein
MAPRNTQLVPDISGRPPGSSRNPLTTNLSAALHVRLEEAPPGDIPNCNPPQPTRPNLHGMVCRAEGELIEM